MRTHTGEKPFKCEVCDTMFSSKGIFTSHLRTHTGETPFKFNICAKIFSQRDYLHSHLRFQTGRNLRNVMCLVKGLLKVLT